MKLRSLIVPSFGIHYPVKKTSLEPTNIPAIPGTDYARNLEHDTLLTGNVALHAGLLGF